MTSDENVRIVHINVRLAEGGAARIALDLHSRAVSAGMNSRFFYGYGKGARPSAYEGRIAGASHIANRIQVMGNYATHRLFGKEVFLPSRYARTELRRAVETADVVHLHAVHSYFMPFRWLSAVLGHAKKIIWTCHDFWAITGRCAFTEGCEGWKQGCGTCPTTRNYPPAYFDLSASEFKQRRSLIEKRLSNIVFVAPSMYVREQFECAYPGARIELIHNGLDAEFEKLAKTGGAEIGATNGERLRIAIMANDLSDETKIDRRLVETLLRFEHIEIHAIGRSSPFAGKRVVNYGDIAERRNLIDTLKMTDALLFTSEKDTFGLVMVEAMACGVPVVAIPSDAAMEVMGLVGQSCFSKADLVKLFSESESAKSTLRSMRDRSRNVFGVFSGSAMFENYVRLWGE